MLPCKITSTCAFNSKMVSLLPNANERIDKVPGDYLEVLSTSLSSSFGALFQGCDASYINDSSIRIGPIWTYSRSITSPIQAEAELEPDTSISGRITGRS